MLRTFCRLRTNKSARNLIETTKMTKIVKIDETDLKDLVSLATKSLKSGKIIAVPTDTIYGVAGLAQKSDAVNRIYDIKNRNHSKPVAISVADIDDIYKWGQVTVSRCVLADLLPGPVTVVFKRTEELCPSLNPSTSLIGIRIPDHTFMREIARACQEPIALTSANISCASSTVSVEEFSELWPVLDAVFDGGVLGVTAAARLGSTVVDLSKEGYYTVIRDGSALQPTKEVLEKHGLINNKYSTQSGDCTKDSDSKKQCEGHSDVKLNNSQAVKCDKVEESETNSHDTEIPTNIQNGRSENTIETKGKICES